MHVPHPKGRKVVCICTKDNIIDEKYQYEDIGLNGSDYTLLDEEGGGSI